MAKRGKKLTHSQRTTLNAMKIKNIDDYLFQKSEFIHPDVNRKGLSKEDMKIEQWILEKKSTGEVVAIDVRIL